MTRNPTAVSPRTTVSEAQERMDEKGIRHMLVVDGDELVGVICSCDLRDRPGGAAVAGCMGETVRTIRDDATVSDAADVMRSQQVGCLVVTWGGGVQGLVTRTDLRRAGVPLERLVDGLVGVASCFDCLERTSPVEYEEYDLGCTD